MEKSTFDALKIRNEFPILNQKIGKYPLIYLDNAASSQKPKVVVEAISHYYLNNHSNVHRGVHILSQRATDAYEATRATAAQYLNVSKEEIVFTKGTTEAINLVAYSFGEAFIQPGDEILITQMEHHANIVPWQMLCQRKDCKLVVANIMQDGSLNMTDFEQKLGPKTKLVALSYASNTLGSINPLKEIISLAHSNNSKVLVDGAQAMPHFKTDLQALDCDFFALSSHKMYGPTGVGLLYGKAHLLDQMPPYQGGGDMIKEVTFDQTSYNAIPLKFEAGTPNIADIVAFEKAFHFLNNLNLAQATKYEMELYQTMIDGLGQIKGIEFYGTATHKVALQSFNIKGIHPYDLGVILDKYGIAVRTGHHCTQPLMSHFQIPGTVRASLAFYNLPQEIDFFLTAIDKAALMLS